MKWLVTTQKDVKRPVLEQVLGSLGGSLEDADPVPFEDGTVVYAATGPRDLPKKAKAREEIVAVHPNTPLDLV